LAKILLIDDSELALTWAEARLTEAGHTVIARDEPLGAGLIIVREKPDLVLIDVAMPSLNGDELVKLLKRHAGMHNSVLVLYSSSHAPELASLAEGCGADGYMPKSADPDEFMRLVDGFLAQRGHRD